MKNTFSLAAAALAVALCGSAAHAEQYWQVRGGVTSVTLFRSLIRDLGMEVTQLKQTAQPMDDMEDPVGFAVARDSNLSFTVRGGAFRGWGEGEIRHSGGFSLRTAKGTQPVQNFAVFFRNTGTNNNLFIRAVSGASPVRFDLASAKIIFDRERKELLIGFMDMLISREWARAIGRPDLAGQLVGMTSVVADVEQIGGDKHDPIPARAVKPELDAAIDIELFDVSQLTSLGRIGTFPNGVSGLAVSTTACNRGSTNAPWFAPMNENHPTIAQNLYRLLNGRLEQLGQSWLKHGFLSTNSPGCGVCQNPGSGNFLGPMCTDTYGAGLNGDRTYLGPRSEVNPFTGHWTCLGSHFAGGQPDCVRRHSSAGHNAVEHRLEVLDADLNIIGATFQYEAYYLLDNDVNRYNNVAHRPCTATWTGTTWSFTTTGVQTFGPAINSWGDMRAFGMPQDEGDAIVAVRVVSLGGGMWNYDYAVYIHTLDRQIRSFTVPVKKGLTVQNIQFRDLDQIAANNWQSNYSNGRVTWFTDTFAQNPSANSIKYGTMYNFRFDANAAPVDATGTLGLYKPGVMDTLSVATKAPPSDPAVYPTSFAIVRGLLRSGGLGNLLFSEDSYLLMGPGPVLSAQESPVQITVDTTSPVAAPAELRFTLEAAASISNIAQKIELYNYTSQAWEQVDARMATTSDSVTEVVVTGSPSRFIRPVTREMSARLSWKEAGPVISYPWQIRIDQSIWKVTP